MRAVLTINLAALVNNYALIQARVGAACAVAPAVKADAYGLGMAQCAPVLYVAGARQFFVALPEEGEALRRVLPHVEIFVLHGFSSGEGAIFEEANLIPVLNAPAQISAYAAEARRRGKSLPCALHCDTGMNRLGLKAQELSGIELQGLELSLVMSHFTSSDELNSAFTAEQAAHFNSITRAFPKVRRSLANSSGVFRSSAYHYDMVRPGYALYGGNPVPEQVNPMAAVVSLNAPVLQVHAVRAGETAGYGQSYRFERDGHVAVLGLGYADGFLRAGSNAACVYWHGIPLPIRGRVSMDLVICDLTQVPEQDFPMPGDIMEVLGPNQGIEALARAMGTIGYEVLTSLSSGRFARRYEQAPV